MKRKGERGEEGFERKEEERIKREEEGDLEELATVAAGRRVDGERFELFALGL